MYHSWVQQRNERGDCTEKVPEYLLGSDNRELVCKFMRYFVLEVRQENGEQYNPGTIRSLLSGINRTMRERGVLFSIFNKNDPAFRELMLTLDSVTSNLHHCGIGASRKHAPVICIDHEHMFWEKGLLGFDDTKVLQRAAFFCMGLHFVLRGVEEQHQLKRKQLVRHPADFNVYSDDVYYEYIEYISKNNQHRFKDINSHSKTVKAFASPGGNHCIVRVFDAYIQKLPDFPDDFYLRPLLQTPHSGPWYARAKVGVNTLKKILPELSKEAAVGVHYTNHSLRATAITRMYEGGVPENLISEKSGHKSIKALRSYESTSIQQEKVAGSMISGEACSVVPALLPATIPPRMLPNSEFQGPSMPTSEAQWPEFHGSSTSMPTSEAQRPNNMPTFSGLNNCTFNFYSK